MSFEWTLKQIQELLKLYDINDSWEQIRNMPFAGWKRKVNGTIESKHHQRLKKGFDGALCEKQKGPVSLETGTQTVK